jgi:hypothetical protein
MFDLSAYLATAWDWCTGICSGFFHAPPAYSTMTFQTVEGELSNFLLTFNLLMSFQLLQKITYNLPNLELAARSRKSVRGRGYQSSQESDRSLPLIYSGKVVGDDWSSQVVKMKRNFAAAWITSGCLRTWTFSLGN